MKRFAILSLRPSGVRYNSGNSCGVDIRVVERTVVKTCMPPNARYSATNLRQPVGHFESDLLEGIRIGRAVVDIAWLAWVFLEWTIVIVDWTANLPFAAIGLEN